MIDKTGKEACYWGRETVASSLNCKVACQAWRELHVLYMLYMLPVAVRAGLVRGMVGNDRAPIALG